MIEHVAQEYLSTYFECCEKLLKEKDGIIVFQVATMPETRYDRYCQEVDFIKKYIFPGKKEFNRFQLSKLFTTINFFYLFI